MFLNFTPKKQHVSLSQVQGMEYIHNTWFYAFGRLNLEEMSEVLNYFWILARYYSGEDDSKKVADIKYSTPKYGWQNENNQSLWFK